MVGKPAQNAVLLRDDSLGVSTEETPRHIQERGDTDNGYYCSVNHDWLEQLSLAEQGTPTLHSLSVAHYPVIVQNPAIIIQPADILEDEL